MSRTRPRLYCMLFPLLLAAAGVHAQTCLPRADGDWTKWLQAQEAAGGHTKACHVDVAVSGLIGRLEDRGGNVSGVCQQAGTASSWSSVKALLDAIRPIIEANARTIANGAAGNHVYDGTAGQTIGTSVTAFEGTDRSKNRNACARNNGYVCTSARSWVAIVQKAAGGDCFLLTAYPT